MSAPTATASSGTRLRRWSRFTTSPVAAWALALGVLVHLAGFFAFSIAVPADDLSPIPEPGIAYGGPAGEGGGLLAEQSALMDFEPLFLPTSRNASAYLGWGDLVERTEPFSALPSRTLIDASQFPPLASQLEAPVEAPIELLERSRGGSFRAFGQVSSQLNTLPKRAGVVEVYREGDSQAVVKQGLDSELILDSVDNLGSILEWRLTVSSAGVIGQPLLEQGSGVEAVESASAEFLNEAAPTWGLEPGYYRIVIGP